MQKGQDRLRWRRHARTTAMAAVGLLLALGAALPSSATSMPESRVLPSAHRASTAAEPFGLPIRWATGPLRIVYGDYWSYTFYTDSGFTYDPAGVVELDGPLSDFAPNAVIVSNVKAPDSVSDVIGYLVPPLLAPPLSAGTYQFSPRLQWMLYDQPFVAEPAAPATLTIDPAALRVDSRVQQDSNNPVVTVISASLTGQYIDTWGWTSSYPDIEPSSARVPGGTWRIVVTDERGTTVVDETVERAEGAVASTTLALADLPRAGTLSAAVSFTLAPSSAGNFTLTQAQTFEFTTPAEARPVLVVEDDTLDEATPIIDPGPTVPIALVGLAGLIGVALATVILLQALRMRRGPRGDSAASDAPDSAQSTEPEATP